MSAWDDFLREIKRARASLSCAKSGAWYRGHASCNYKLTPKLFRSKHREGVNREREIYKEYTRHLGKVGNSSWEHLIDMQHYGIETRLLDWTETFGVALYFAIMSENTQLESPCMWITNPFTLSAKARRNNETSIGDFHMDSEMDYFDRFIRNKSWPHDRPFPFYSPTPNKRIIAQKGFFTIHGNIEEPLEVICRRHVRKVVIPTEALDDATEFLELSGIDHLSMFPDYEGFNKMINKKYV